MRTSGRITAGLLLSVALGVAVAAGVLLHGGGQRAPEPLPPAIARVRAQLALGPVLTAAAALERNPGNPAARLRLARACRGAGDPAGAALALYPLVEAAGPVDGSSPGRGAPRGRPAATDASKSRNASTPTPRLAPSPRRPLAPSPPRPLAPSTDCAAEYVRCCLQVGWLDEAAATLPRLPAPQRLRLDLAAAYAEHGQAARAEALLAVLRRERLNADEWLDGAITAYHCRRPDEAVEWARQAVAAAPDNPAARAVLARCFLTAGQPEAALPVLPDPQLVPPPARPLLTYWRARVQVRCADAARRRAGREELARLAGETGDPAAAFEAGRAFLQAGQPAPAVGLLSRAAVGKYQEVLCYDLLARAYTSLGQPAAALWARGRAQAQRGQFQAASRSLRESVQRDPTRPLAFVDLARALEADGQAQEALAALQQAEKAAPGNLDVSLLKARLLLHLEQVPAVIRTLTRAAALDARRANEPLGNLGTVFYDSQQYDRAVPVLQRAVESEPNDAHSHFYLGRIFARRLEEPGRAEAAVDHLLRAAQMEPDYSRPWMEAAAVLQRMGALPEAAACLRRAIDGECQSDAPYVPLAELLLRLGRLPERELVLRQYASIRDHDLTRTGLEKQTRDNPKDPARRFALGDLLLREGRPDKALPELLAAAGMRPGWQRAQLRLADTCALLDDDDLRQEAERAARGARRRTGLAVPGSGLRQGSAKARRSAKARSQAVSASERNGSNHRGTEGTEGRTSS